MIARIGANRWLAGAIGAAIAISLTGLIAQRFFPPGYHGPLVVASMGASAILVFVVPASPLSQPRAVFGGHMLAASVGLLVRPAVPDPWLAAGLAIGIAIAVMNLLRCLHPPAGGTVLLAVFAAAPEPASRWTFLIMPLALDVLLLLVCAIAWNRLTGHSYPHRVPTVPAPAAWVGHIEDDDLDAVLAEWDEALDISRDDLLAVLHAAERRVIERWKGSGI